MIVGVHHIAIGVSDFDKGLKFYRDGLGFEVVQQSEIRNNPAADRAIGITGVNARMAMLKGYNLHIELWQYQQPEPQDRISQPNDYGYPHMALQVDDIEAEYDRLASHGMRFVGPVEHFSAAASAVYGRDPFGNVIELYEIKDPATAQLARR